MTELARIKIEKNFSIKKISELCGYKPRMVQYFLSGKHATPHGVIPAVQLEPREYTDKITRWEFIETLKELGMTPKQAATILVKHLERIENMADEKKDMDRRVALKRTDLDKLRERA